MMSTKNWLAVTIAACGSALLLGCNSGTAVQAAGPTGVKNILLVHGAWADGSSWSKVIRFCRRMDTT